MSNMHVHPTIAAALASCMQQPACAAISNWRAVSNNLYDRSRPSSEERADREQDADDREFARRVAALLAPGGKFDAADPANVEYSAADLIEVAEFQAEEDMFYASLPRAAGQMIP
jgi:hypothetical protein